MGLSIVGWVAVFLATQPVRWIYRPRMIGGGFFMDGGWVADGNPTY